MKVHLLSSFSSALLCVLWPWNTFHSFLYFPPTEDSGPKMTEVLPSVGKHFHHLPLTIKFGPVTYLAQLTENT